MIMRPVDDTGDMLPVLTSSDLVSGPEAVDLPVKGPAAPAAGGMAGESGHRVSGIEIPAGRTDNKSGHFRAVLTDYGVYPGNAGGAERGGYTV